jgi:hypothetical protein
MSRWERILLVLGVCLPVPLLAATGLSIPLPATVERLAAGLVPFAQAATRQDASSARAPRGVIVRAPGEAAPEGSEPTPFMPVDSGASDRPRAPVRGSRPDKKGQAPTSNTTGRLKDDPSAPDAPAAPGDRKPTPGVGGGDSGASPPPPPPAQPEPQPQPGPEPQPQPQPEPAPQPQPPSPPPPPPPPPAPLPLPLPVPLPPPPPLLPPPPPLPDLGG